MADSPSFYTLPNGQGSTSSTTVTASPLVPLPINYGGTGKATANDALNALLPTQAGNANKFLRTNGANATWQTALDGIADQSLSPKKLSNNETKPLFIAIAGQSLALGKYSGGPNPANPRVKCWDATLGVWGSSDITKTPWTYPQPGGNSGSNNYALAAAHKLVEQLDRDVYLVLDATSGTSIDKWVETGITSLRYAALRTKVAACLATPQLSSAGITKLDFLIWSQGEEDYNTSFSTYLTKLTTLDTQLRAETWMTSTTPVFLTGMSHLHDRYQIAPAHRHYCAQVNANWRYVNASGLLVDGVTDFTHFLGPSIWEMGYERIARMYLSQRPEPVSDQMLFYGRGNGKATIADPTAIATFTNLVNWDSRTLGSDAINGPAATGSISWGYQAYADGNYTFAFGYNVVTDNLCNYTLAAGRDTLADANGKYGFVAGYQNTLSAQYSFAAGRGNTIADQGGAAVGTFAQYATAQTDLALFQVGIGTSTSNRKNAFAVRQSGILEAKNLPTYATEAAAVTGGLTSGQIYKTATGELRIKL